MAFVRAAGTKEIEPGTIRECDVRGTLVALAHLQDKFFAISNICVHRGGPLGQGELADEVVTCPWHGWEFNVQTGKCVLNPEMAVACYAVEVRGDEVFVDIG
jgi:nitrite reductase (NADH) small subunit